MPNYDVYKDGNEWVGKRSEAFRRVPRIRPQQHPSRRLRRDEGDLVAQWRR